MSKLIIEIPRDLQDEMNKHPEINWNYYALEGIRTRLNTRPKYNHKLMTKHDEPKNFMGELFTKEDEGDL